ncbi:hypothetical protein BJV74DRAFT_214982 [Russula compacta]|nr:hypothetical protein BJV74DRAFT_214982 [Russula compacta]
MVHLQKARTCIECVVNSGLIEHDRTSCRDTAIFGPSANYWGKRASSQRRRGISSQCLATDSSRRHARD